MLAYKYYVKNNFGGHMANKFSEFSDYKTIDVNKVQKDSPEFVESIEDKIEKYSAYSSDELMQEFLNISKQQKLSGKLNSEYISNIKNTLAPYLSVEQKNTLNSLMDKIDE